MILATKNLFLCITSSSKIFVKDIDQAAISFYNDNTFFD